MPYTVRMLGTTDPAKVLARLQKKLAEKKCRFAIFDPKIVEQDLLLPTIRLKKPQPYYGNHPDAEELHHRPTEVKNRRFPDHESWVEFNNLLNDILDKLQASANVFSRPWGIGTFWIRKGGRRRVRYDVVNGVDPFGRRRTTLDPGTDSQFGGDVSLYFPDLSNI